VRASSVNSAVRTSWPTLFIDHPVRPPAIRDPLVLAAERVPSEASISIGGGPQIGFAALWEPVPERTWSGSAWNLLQGLLRAAPTTDVGIHMSRFSLTAFKALHTRYRYGQLVARWTSSRMTDAYLTRTLRQAAHANARDNSYDAIVTIDTLADPGVPFFVFYDISWEAMIASAESARAYAELRGLKLSVMNYVRDHQQEIYNRATGIIALSNWFARSLVEQSGVPPEKIYVAHPGFSAGRLIEAHDRDDDLPEKNDGINSSREVPIRDAPRRRLLFVGRQNTNYDFYRKGGDLVVDALTILRSDYDNKITLTMVGMDYWPLPGTPPPGVRLLGYVPPSKVSGLYDSHDLLVMPSRMEPFGVVFVEALAHGIPCVARDAYAMPEVVTPGVSGALVTKDDPHELAATIASVLADDGIYESCRVRAPQMASYFSWDRTGRDVARIIGEATT
jgi:glycosyltransferase involved in cell wall biosynthesis